jgi:hypothetical protein
MADTLDLCLRFLDAAMLEAVVPLLSQKVSGPYSDLFDANRTNGDSGGSDDL